MVKKATKIIEYGVWIDHKKAMIGYFDFHGNFIYKIFYSGIETRIRFKGETTDRIRTGTSKRNRQKQKQNKLQNQLKKFCGKVGSLLKNMNAVLILGPSDTKYKLLKLLKENKSFQDVWINIRPADKLSKAEFKKAIMAHYV